MCIPKAVSPCKLSLRWKVNRDKQPVNIVAKFKVLRVLTQFACLCSNC